MYVLQQRKSTGYFAHDRKHELNLLYFCIDIIWFICMMQCSVCNECVFSAAEMRSQVGTCFLAQCDVMFVVYFRNGGSHEKGGQSGCRTDCGGAKPAICGLQKRDWCPESLLANHLEPGAEGWQVWGETSHQQRVQGAGGYLWCLIPLLLCWNVLFLSFTGMDYRHTNLEQLHVGKSSFPHLPRSVRK